MCRLEQGTNDGETFKPYEVMTADTTGVFKVWDMRNFKCLQTFDSLAGDSSETSGLVNFSFIPGRRRSESELMEKKSNNVSTDGDYGSSSGGGEDECGDEKINRMARVFTATRTLVRVFEREAPPGAGVKSLTDDKATNSVLYSSSRDRIVTIHDKSIKIWCASNGSLRRELRSLTSHSITSACVCGNDATSFLLGTLSLSLSLSLSLTHTHTHTGTHDGSIASYDFISGTKLKTFFAHDCEIVSLRYDSKTKTFFSIDWRGNILRHDDSGEEGGEEFVLCKFDPKRVSNHHKDVTTAALSCALLATGSADGTVRLWHANEGKLVSILKHGAKNIDSFNITETRRKRYTTCLCFLEPAELLVCAESTGHLEIWSFASRRFDRVARLDPFSKPHIAVCTVQLSWDAKSKRLYVANDDGSTCCVQFVETWWNRATRGRFKEESRDTKNVLKIMWTCSNAHSAMITGMVLTSSSSHLMTSSYDRTVKLWCAKSGKFVASLRQGMLSSDWRMDIDGGMMHDEEMEEKEEENEDEEEISRAGCGIAGPECEDLKTRFPKIRSTQAARKACSSGKNKKRRGVASDHQEDSGTELCGERTMELLNLPEISSTAARMARRDESDDSFTLKQLFQRAIWNAMKGKPEHLKTIAEEAEKAGMSSIVRLAKALYTQKTQYPL